MTTKLISTGVEFPDATTQTSATNTSASTAELDILDGATLTTAELNTLNGVTSAVQTQIDAKEPADATILKDADVGTTANKLVQLNASAELPAVSGANLTNLPAGGASALNDLTDGYYAGYSVGIGNGALNSDDGTDNDNSAIGYQSLYSNTSGTGNSASGYQSLKYNTTGSRNIASGYQSLFSNTTAINNIATGYFALYSNTTGYDNTATGWAAMFYNTTGTQGTAYGMEALKNNTTSGSNTAIGFRSLSNTTGDNNTAIGGSSGQGITTGGSNIAIGKSVLTGTTTGSQNTYIGESNGDSGVTGSNNMALGYHAGRSDSPSGNITSGSNIICLGNSSVTALYCADTSISSSDGRDKTDVEDFTAGLDFITQMRPVTYRWDKRTSYIGKDATSQDILDVVPDGTHKKPKQHIGFISQEVQVLEQALGFATSKDNELICNTNEDGTAMGLKYERLVPVLVNAIKELSAKVEALENA